ncbi:hypothetical protein D3C85_1331890 [compost metagenome]
MGQRGGEGREGKGNDAAHQQMPHIQYAVQTRQVERRQHGTRSKKRHEQAITTGVHAQFLLGHQWHQCPQSASAAGEYQHLLHGAEQYRRMADVTQATAHASGQGFRWQAHGWRVGYQAKEEEQHREHAQRDGQKHRSGVPVSNQGTGQRRPQSAGRVDGNAVQRHGRRHLVAGKYTDHGHHPRRHSQCTAGTQDKGERQ